MGGRGKGPVKRRSHGHTGSYGQSGQASAKKFKGTPKVVTGKVSKGGSAESSGSTKGTTDTTTASTSKKKSEVGIKDDVYTVDTKKPSTTKETATSTPRAKAQKRVTVHDSKPPVETKDKKDEGTSKESKKTTAADVLVSGVSIYTTPDVKDAVRRGSEAFGNFPVIGKIAGYIYGAYTLFRNYGVVGKRIVEVKAPDIAPYKGEVRDWMKESVTVGDVVIIEGKWAEVIKINSARIEYRFVHEKTTHTTDVTDSLFRQNAAELPINLIRPTMNGLSGPRLINSMHRTNEFITVAVVDGKYYCVDGHHRLRYLSADNKTTVNVRYVHMTKTELNKRLAVGRGTRFEVPDNVTALKVDKSRTDTPTQVSRNRSEPTPDTRSAELAGVDKTRPERLVNRFVEYFTGQGLKELNALATSSQPAVSASAKLFRGRILVIQKWVRDFRKLEDMNPADRSKAEAVLIAEIRTTMGVIEKIDPVFHQTLSHKKGERDLLDNFYTVMNGVIDTRLRNSPYNQMEQRFVDTVTTEKQRLGTVQQILNVVMLHSGGSLHYENRQGNVSEMAPYMRKKSEVNADTSSPKDSSSTSSTETKKKVDTDAVDTVVQSTGRASTESGPVVIDYNLVPAGKIFGFDISTPLTVIGWVHVEVAVRNNLTQAQKLELARYLTVEAGWKTDRLSKMFGKDWVQKYADTPTSTKDTSSTTPTSANKKIVDEFIDKSHEPYYEDVVDLMITPDKAPAVKLAGEMGITKLASVLTATKGDAKARENVDVLMQQGTGSNKDAAHVRNFLKTASADQILLLVSVKTRNGIISYLKNNGHLDILSGDPSSHVVRIEGIKDVATRDLLLALCAHREFQLRKEHPYRKSPEGLDLLHRFGIDHHAHTIFPWNRADTLSRASLYFRVKAEKRLFNNIFAKAAPGKEGAAKALVDKIWGMIRLQDVKDTNLPYTPHGWQHTLDVVKLQRNIYNSSPALRDALIKQYGSEAKALAVMDAVALIHDVGYGLLQPGESKGWHARHSGMAFKRSLAKDFKELYDLTDKQVEDIFLAIERHGADKEGKGGYMKASLDNPLLFIIRLADNLDSSRVRLRSAQTNPQFVSALKDMNNLKKNDNFVNGSKETQKEMLAAIRLEYQLHFALNMSPNDAKLANALLAEMNHESWPHFKGAEKTSNVYLSVEKGQLVVEFRIAGWSNSGTVSEKNGSVQVDGSLYQLWRAFESGKSMDHGGMPILFRYKEVAPSDPLTGVTESMGSTKDYKVQDGNGK